MKTNKEFSLNLQLFERRRIFSVLLTSKDHVSRKSGHEVVQEIRVDETTYRETEKELRET